MITRKKWAISSLLIGFSAGAILLFQNCGMSGFGAGVSLSAPGGELTIAPELIANTGSPIPALPSPTGKLGAAVKLNSISIGRENFCGITEEHRLLCVGYNFYGIGNGTFRKPVTYPIYIDPQETYAQVSLGERHSCGVTRAGVLKCWGVNDTAALGFTSAGMVLTPTISDPGTLYSKVVVTSQRSCGITVAGALKCWGTSSDGILGDGQSVNIRQAATRVDPGETFIDVVITARDSCAITTNHVLKCWGLNVAGEVGDGTNVRKATPVIIDNGVAYDAIAQSTSGVFTCGVTSGKKLKCWGNNVYNNLGDNSYASKTRPADVDVGTDYESADLYEFTGCALTTAQKIKCWGLNLNGEVGNGLFNDQFIPVEIDSAETYLSVKRQADHTCGLTTKHEVKCWGRYTIWNREASPWAFYDPIDSFDPQQKYKDLVLGQNNGCAVRSDRTLVCWGSNNAGILGDGTSQSTTSQIAIDSTEQYTSVASSGSLQGLTRHACALSVNGVIKCWGAGGSGQLGTGLKRDESTPKSVPGTFKVVSPGVDFTLAITSNGELQCWGLSTNGQCGNMTATNLNPVTIDAATVYEAVSAGQTYGCAITTAKVLKCWGNNRSSTVGVPGAELYLVPVVVDSGVTYQSISTYSTYACGVTTDGYLKCWGWDSNGSLGFIGGRGSYQTSPTLHDADERYVSVAAGPQMICGITKRSRLKCWGEYYDKRSAIIVSTSPRIMDSKNMYSKVSVNYGSVCALTTAGQLRCFGNNYFNVVGVPNFVDKIKPTLVPMQPDI